MFCIKLQWILSSCFVTTDVDAGGEKKEQLVSGVICLYGELHLIN